MLFFFAGHHPPWAQEGGITDALKMAEQKVGGPWVPEEITELLNHPTLGPPDIHTSCLVW